MATAAGVPAVLDAHGEALRRGAAARPAIVKPNLAELEALAGRTLSTARGADKGAVALAARELMAAGPQAVVVTLGADGLWAITGDGSWQAVPPADVAGDPTRAGGARAAGPGHGLGPGRPWGGGVRPPAPRRVSPAPPPGPGGVSA